MIADPKYNPWLAVFEKSGVIGEMPVSNGLGFEYELAKQLGYDEKVANVAQDLFLKHHAVVSDVKPEDLKEVLDITAHFVFSAAVSKNFHPDHTEQIAVYGRLMGNASIINGLWEGQWRRVYDHAHNMPDFVNERDATRKEIKETGGVAAVVRRNMQIANTLTI